MRVNEQLLKTSGADVLSSGKTQKNLTPPAHERPRVKGRHAIRIHKLLYFTLGLGLQELFIKE